MIGLGSTCNLAVVFLLTVGLVQNGGRNGTGALLCPGDSQEISSRPQAFSRILKSCQMF